MYYRRRYINVRLWGIIFQNKRTFGQNKNYFYISCPLHQDHLNKTTVKQIAYNYPNIKFICGSSDVLNKLISIGVQAKNIYILKIGHKFDLGIIRVKVEEVIHDVQNFLLKWEYDGKKGIYIVDTENIDNVVAKDYDLYLIENNYRDDILQEHIKNCEDEDMLYYLNRVPKTHLSDEQANSFLIENMGKNSVYEYIHQSKYNFEERE